MDWLVSTLEMLGSILDWPEIFHQETVVSTWGLMVNILLVTTHEQDSSLD